MKNMEDNFFEKIRNDTRRAVLNAKLATRHAHGDKPAKDLGITETNFDEALRVLFSKKSSHRVHSFKTTLSTITLSCFVSDKLTAESIWPTWELVKQRIRNTSIGGLAFVLADDAIRDDIIVLRGVTIQYESANKDCGVFSILIDVHILEGEAAIRFNSNLKAFLF